MATVTKAVTAILNGVTMTAAASDVTTDGPDLDTSFGAQLGIKLTNGATGPTVAAQVQIQVSQDDSKFYNFGGALVGSVANSAVSSWSIEIPIGVEHIQLVSGSNTGQNVTVDADISQVTAIS